VSDSSTVAGYGRVRWRRFGLILIPAAAVAIILVVLTAQSVLAVSFAISGVPFTVTASQLNGQGFEDFGVVDHSISRNLPSGTTHMVLSASAIRSATISHLCLSVALLGAATLRITAADGGSQVSGTDLVIDANRLSGNASFTKMTIGQDASTLTEVPGVKGGVGDFSLASRTIAISNLRTHAYATTAGTFTLPGLSLRFGSPC
jgi:Family of unknown function (DUF6230)